MVGHRAILVISMAMVMYAQMKIGQATTRSCFRSGISINGTFGTIASPNYNNGTYPDATTCIWTILSPEGTRIGIKFEALFGIETLENPALGCFDHLVFSEPTKPSKNLCGFKTPTSFVSDGNALTVTFTTDPFVNFVGFSFNWTAVSSESIPAPVLMTAYSNQSLSSPNYPLNYDPLTQLAWTVYGTPGKLLVVEFAPHFGIEDFNGDTCPYDALTIYEGPGWRYTRTFCSYTQPVAHLFQYHVVHIAFRSDITVEGVGFSLNFTEVDSPVCDAPFVQTGTSGTIISPLYPLGYTAGLDCEWHITGPENMRIAIRFNDPFGIESSAGCQLASLQIFDGPSKNSTQYQGNLCGNYAPRGFLSSSNEVTVRFDSINAIERNSGFSINWTAEAICNSDKFQCWDGSCISGLAKCDGTVDCPADIADEAVCSRTSLSSECGIPEISPHFKWDARIVGGHVAKRGSWPWIGNMLVLFRGNWHFQCGATLISAEWALTAAHCLVKGLDIRLTFGDYELWEYTAEEEQIMTVDNSFVHPDYRYYETNPFMYGHDIALLHLSTPLNITTWVKPACLPDSPPAAGTQVVLAGWGRTSIYDAAETDILRQVRERVTTYGECNKAYDFEVPSDVFCAGIPTGGASSCMGDSGGPAVELRNGTWVVVGLVSFATDCGIRPGIPSALAGVHASLSFINDVLENGLEEKEIFQHVISGDSSGTITSPNYGTGLYPPGVHTRWYITGPEDTIIAVRFSDDFNIEWALYGQPCTTDYLLIYDAASTLGLKYGNKKLCGNRAPPDFESNSNGIIVEFSTDYAFENTGFSLTWNAVESCKSDEFRCWNTTCIPNSKQCDKNYDCVEHEDEFSCALATAGSTQCGKPEIPPQFPWNSLVVGGYNSREGSWPWQVALYRLLPSGEWWFTCGGSLIAEDTVMTASHCVEIGTTYQVIVGNYDLSTISPHERRINVTYMFVNPNYTNPITGSLINDIAILKLQQPVDFTSKWYKPVCLPPPDYLEPEVNMTCVITGWGVTSGIRGSTHSVPNIMQQSHINILNDSRCHEVVPPSSVWFRHFLCVKVIEERIGGCFGDSGGPLVCLVRGSWVQYGIASWVTQCGRHSAYERVSLHSDFIAEGLAFKGCKDFEIIEGTSGTVSSPSFLGQYVPNLSCSWLLQGPVDMVLVITFNLFDIESCDQALYDYVNIYDGNTTSARKFLDESLCGTDRALRGFESSTNEVFITFVSDGSVQESGFSIEWKAVDDCDSDQFRCWDGSCIDGASKCDGSINCDDKSDEMECSHYGLECGRQDVEPDFVWAARVVGGSYARNGSWPFQVFVVDQAGQFLCAATIINKNWALTSAECVELVTQTIYIIVGENRLDSIAEATMILVASVHIHEEYKVADGYNIALLNLNEDIQLSSTVQPACMAIEDTTEELAAGERCVFLGWGSTQVTTVAVDLSLRLRQTVVPIVHQDICKKIVDPFNRDRMLCTGDVDSGGVGACNGDSGGPLMCFRDNAWVQFGVAIRPFGCGNVGSPDPFTKVSFFTEWIEKKINGTLPIPSPVPTTTTSTTQSATETTTDILKTAGPPVETTNSAEPNATSTSSSTSQSTTTTGSTTSAASTADISHIVLLSTIAFFLLTTF